MSTKTLTLAAAYLGSIVAAAWVITHIGAQYDPHGPHVLPVWPGIEAPSGVYIIGITLVLRDLLQRNAGKAITFALVLVGAALAALISPAIAIASGLAFLASELIDFALFTATEKRLGLIPAVALSNAVSLVIDSIVFLTLAFGSLQFMQGQIIGKAWATLAAIVALWALQRRRDALAA